MFTGIVQAIGTIEAVTPLEKGVRLVVETADLGTADVKLGDSICIQGACMTVVAMAGSRLSFDVSRESLDCTTGLAAPGRVNLEKALALGDRVGGHLVTGHVDGLGEVMAFEQAGESWRLEVRAPSDLARYLARKGSITVDGVSLTVNRVEDGAQGTRFEVNLIPHTVAVTTLARLAPGARVNLEVDLIARYTDRLASAPR
ncbi:MAG: riboflavin synthase [Betaproteobacteria bacterium]|jgi:riboflavin synthase|nr:riboflavin synthase [Betaproteobacteria bacterium]